MLQKKSKVVESHTWLADSSFFRYQEPTTLSFGVGGHDNIQTLSPDSIRRKEEEEDNTQKLLLSSLLFPPHPWSEGTGVMEWLVLHIIFGHNVSNAFHTE